MISKVWIIKEQMVRGGLGSTAMDYSPAMRYGELHFITAIDLPLHGKSTLNEVWHKQVEKFVRDYKPTSDYIITTGQPLSIFLVGWWLAVVGKIPHRFLVWRPQENLYRPVEFNGDMINDFWYIDRR